MNSADQQPEQPPKVESPTAVSSPAEPSSPPMRRRRRWPFVVLAVLAVIGATVVFGLDPLVRHLAVEQARQHGIALSLGEVTVGWASVEIEDFRFSLLGMDGVTGKAEVLAIELDGLTPTGIEARGAQVEIVGTAAALAMDFSEWTKNHPELLRIPAKAEQIDVTWRPDDGAEAWLAIAGASVAPTESGGDFVAQSATVVGLDVGKVGASWKGNLSKIALGFGEAELERAPVTIDVTYASHVPEAVITLRPTPLERLAAPLGVALPVKGVTASGRADLRFSPEPTAGPLHGTLAAKLVGYSPPVPKEIGAFVFGDTTELNTKLSVSEDQQTVELTETSVKHGTFALAGGGAIHRKADQATVSLDLKGHLACTDLAAAAARARLGKELGRLLGGAARFTLKGSVAVGIKIEASTHDLAAAKLTRSIGVGCGLKSMADLGLPEIPDLKDLPELKDLPKLPGLPELPRLEAE